MRSTKYEKWIHKLEDKATAWNQNTAVTVQETLPIKINLIRLMYSI